MQTMKKVISVVLAVIMIASVFVFSSSAAGAAAPSGDYKISMAYELVDESGKTITSVEPGQTVKLYVYTNSSTANDLMSTFYHSIYFDKDIYSYVGVEWMGLADWIDTSLTKINHFSETNTSTNFTKSKALWTEEEMAAEPKWDSFVYVPGVQKSGATPYTVQENADKPMYALIFKVSTEAQIGASANMGCPASVNWDGKRASYNYTKTAATGNPTNGWWEPSPKLELTVGTQEVVKSIVEYSKTQIRFHGISSKDSPASAYQYKFDVRTVARITEENFQATFDADDATAATMIAEAGFVYAVQTKVPTMDLEKAKSVAEGGSVSNYKKVPVQYMQHANGEYIFTCLITDIGDVDRNNGINCLGYVKDTEGKYYYFDGVQEVNYEDLFEQYFPKA